MKHSTYRELISSTRRGLAADAARAGLAFLSLFYRAAVALRNAGYDWGLLRQHRASVPVVSVGNLTAGGTGKTPVVAAVVEWFRARGIQPVILSRGYRARGEESNDEKLVLDQLCAGVLHLQSADRVAAASEAVARHGAQVLVLDDGFQHRRLARDLEIVLVDALDPWGGGHLLPRGLLREPIASLGRARLVVLTRTDLCTDAARQAILQRAGLEGKAPIAVEIAFEPTGLVNAVGERCELSTLRETPIAAFCGIGNPAGFEQTLDRAGLTISTRGWRTYPDHHAYRPGDLDDLARFAQAAGALALVTTQKDLVKIPRVELGGVPLWALCIRARLAAGEERWNACLERVLAAKSSQAAEQSVNRAGGSW